jgi:hypothetical protein
MSPGVNQDYFAMLTLQCNAEDIEFRAFSGFEIKLKKPQKNYMSGEIKRGVCILGTTGKPLDEYYGLQMETLNF